jgi:hypothetical protein
MEPEGSLSYSQEPATSPCPEPDRSSPCPHPTSRRSTLILSSHLRLCLPSGLLSSRFATRSLNAHLPHTCYMSCPFPSSWLHHPYDTWLKSTEHKVPCYVVFSTLLLPNPSWAQIFSSALYPRKPSVYIPPSMWVTNFHTHTRQQARL